MPTMPTSFDIPGLIPEMSDDEFEDEELTIIASYTTSSFATALEEPISPATSEESALVTPTDAQFFGTLQPLPAEDVKNSMHEVV